MPGWILQIWHRKTICMTYPVSASPGKVIVCLICRCQAEEQNLPSSHPLNNVFLFLPWILIFATPSAGFNL